jgi:GTP cyclohydrolase FolE2
MAEDKLMEKVNKKMKEGWIRTTMMVEVMAMSEDAAKTALEKHIAGIDREDGLIKYKTEWGEMRKVEKPFKNVEVAYSYIAEIEFIAQSFDKLVWAVMTFCPSSIEILEPRNIKMDMGDAQGILNSISDIIHRFAAMGIGGVVVRT